ncbi:MAG: DNA methyltransferase [Planctomycetota bacterium]
MGRAKTMKTTNARPFAARMTAALGRLKGLMAEANHNAWAIGDLVNELKTAGVPVRDQAELIGASRQRLSEMRRTAAAFATETRRVEVDFHFHTVAARSAKRLGLSPVDVLDELVKNGLDSTRAATRYLAERVREQEARRVRGKARVSSGLVNRCHHADFRQVLPQLKTGSVKLVIADPPYGRYGKYRDGQHTRVAAAARDCDGLDDNSARALTIELFQIAAPLMVKGGCLVLFRPGGLADPVWLLSAADQYGWECRHALAWRRGPAKLGDGRAPYTSGTERILVFARRGVSLINHDGSSRSDILEAKCSRKDYARSDQHLFEKPVGLMEALIAKHSYPSELIVEPFGATGPASRAAIRLGRSWLYAESNRRNYTLGHGLITDELSRCCSAAS